MILETSVDRSTGYLPKVGALGDTVIPIYFFMIYRFARLVSPLRGGLHGFCGAWRRYNSLEWSDHSSSLCLALHPNWGKQVFRRQAKTRKNRTLHPVQLRFLG